MKIDGIECDRRSPSAFAVITAVGCGITTLSMCPRISMLTGSSDLSVASKYRRLSSVIDRVPGRSR